MKLVKTSAVCLAALLTVVTMISACGNGGGTPSNNEMNDAAKALKSEMGEKDFNEAANAIKDELTKDTAKETAAPATDAVPEEEEIVTPDASEFKYNYDATIEGVVITGYTGDAKRIRVPSELDGDTVKKLEGEYYHGTYYPAIDTCTYVEIPDTVTVIGDYAFASWSYEGSPLEEIILPEKLESIGKEAFHECKKLTSIKIPEGVTTIEKKTFGSCTALEEVIFPSTLTSIGFNAFGASGLKKIEIPDTVTELDTEIFYQCKNLEEVILPKNITSIPSSMFSWCSSLKEVTIPNSVTSISYDVFSNCTSLRSLALPDGLTFLDTHVFENCDALTVTFKGEKYNHADWDALYNAVKSNS